MWPILLLLFAGAVAERCFNEGHGRGFLLFLPEVSLACLSGMCPEGSSCINNGSHEFCCDDELITRGVLEVIKGLMDGVVRQVLL